MEQCESKLPAGLCTCHTEKHTYQTLSSWKIDWISTCSYSGAFYDISRKYIWSFSVFHAHAPRCTHCNRAWWVRGWGDACICSHAAVMESKTDECAYQAILSAWLQNKKPHNHYLSSCGPSTLISQHMSFCPLAPPSELRVNHLEIIKFNKAEQIK